jgi:hypothetical protein
LKDQALCLIGEDRGHRIIRDSSNSDGAVKRMTS